MDEKYLKDYIERIKDKRAEENNDISNLEWVTRGENIEKFWESLSEEEYANYKRIYSEGLKRAHAEGKYKKHLDEIHERRIKKNEDKNL